jgi:hypothetical protein
MSQDVSGLGAMLVTFREFSLREAYGRMTNGYAMVKPLLTMLYERIPQTLPRC